MYYRKNLLVFVFILLLLEGFSQKVNVQVSHFFSKALTDTFYKTPANRVEIFKIPLHSGNWSSEKSLLDSASITIKDAAKVTKFMAVLKDTLNYLDRNISKSCSFVPQYIFQIFSGKKDVVYILYSHNCEQIAIVSKNFQEVISFGDLNDKGVNSLNPFLNIKG